MLSTLLYLKEKRWHETNTDSSTIQQDEFATAEKNSLWVPPVKKFYSSRPTQGPLAYLALMPHIPKIEIPESVVHMAGTNFFRKLCASPSLAENFEV